MGRNHWNKLRILGRQIYKHINLYDPQNTEPIFEDRKALIKAITESHHDSCQRPKGIPALLPKYSGYANSSHQNTYNSSSSKIHDTTVGMTLLYTIENASNGFNLYFLGYPPESNYVPPKDLSSLAAYEGLLELTWNYGTEKDSSFAYHHGNSEPLGFGHICISVDNLESACTRLDNYGVTWLERQSIGKEGAYFITDPDQYRIKVPPPLVHKLHSNILLTILTLYTTIFSASQMLTFDQQIVQNEALKRSDNWYRHYGSPLVSLSYIFQLFICVSMLSSCI